MRIIWAFFGFMAMILDFSGSSLAMPAQVVLIRHGEKPDVGNELNAQGFERANALPLFFQTNPVVTQFGPVAAIYAMAPGSSDGSLRPIETVTPTARALGLPVQSTLTKDQTSELVSEIEGNPSYDGKTVVICWEHKMIPVIASGFGLKDGPEKWPGSVFDRAWVLGFHSVEGAVSLQDIGEQVLPGDRVH